MSIQLTAATRLRAASLKSFEAKMAAVLIANAKPKDKPSIDGLERAIEIIQRSRI